jgi:hypothetical protein
VQPKSLEVWNYGSMANNYQSDQHGHFPEAKEERLTWLPDRAINDRARLVSAKT